MPFRCPYCNQNGNAGNFKILGSAPMWVEVDADGDQRDTEDPEDPVVWTQDSTMECTVCNHQETVSAFDYTN